MWTKANRLLLNPIKTLQMRKEKKKSHKPLPWMPDLNISIFYWNILKLHDILNCPFPQWNQVGYSEVMHLSLTLSSEADWFQAIIGSYWSHWSDALLTYIVWPLRSFSLSFLSDYISASLQKKKKWKLNTASHQLQWTVAVTLTTTVALGSPQCNSVGYRCWCFCFFVYKKKKPTNEHKKRKTQWEDNWLHKRQKKKTRHNKGIIE